MTNLLPPNTGPVTRYCVLFRQESDFKVETEATSEADALAIVEAALEDGLDLDATPYGGRFDVISASAILPGGAA